MHILILLGSAAFALAINGGKQTDMEYYPHQVQLYRNRYFLCGGSIISPFYILTAAHCVLKDGILWEGDYQVVGGSSKRIHSFKVYGIPKSTQRLKVRHFFLHGKFNDTGLSSNDIAILGVEKPFRYSIYVKKIALPFPKEDFDNTKAIAIGHGASKTVATANYLNKIDVFYGNSSNCDFWSELKDIPHFWKDSQHCIFAYGGNGICNGDSGGALVCGRLEEYGWFRPVLCGIASFSWSRNPNASCGIQEATFFTKVQNYLVWINNITLRHEALSRCDSEHFFCHSNQTCIPRANLCDKVAHCTEGEDELNCENFEKCGESQFKCNNGRCIEASERCDGTFDCADSILTQLSSDEDKCPKSEDEKCDETDHDCGANDRCLPVVYKCDGIPDCLNSSDEEGCSDDYILEDDTPSSSVGISEWIWKTLTIAGFAVNISILLLLFSVLAYFRSRCSASEKQ